MMPDRFDVSTANPRECSCRIAREVAAGVWIEEQKGEIEAADAGAGAFVVYQVVRRDLSSPLGPRRMRVFVCDHSAQGQLIGALA